MNYQVPEVSWISGVKDCVLSGGNCVIFHFQDMQVTASVTKTTSVSKNNNTV